MFEKPNRGSFTFTYPAEPFIVFFQLTAGFTDSKPGGGSTGTEDLPRGPCLTDLSLSVPRGHLVCVVGAVGSGKSSLLSALIGELKYGMPFLNLNVL